MKKSLIGTLALGLIIGTGALTVKSFANERTVDTQLFVNKTNPVVSTTDNQSSYQQDAGFKVLNQETKWSYNQIDINSLKNARVFLAFFYYNKKRYDRIRKEKSEHIINIVKRPLNVEI